MGGNGGRNDQVGGRDFQIPEHVAARIVGANTAVIGGHDLRAQIVLPDERRGPRAASAKERPSRTSRAPALFAGLCVKSGDVPIFHVVVHHHHQTVANYRRGRRAIVEERFLRLDPVRPKSLTREIIAGQSHVAEQGVDALAIGHGRFRGVGALRMARNLWLLPVCFVLPNDLARVQVQTVHHPAVHALGRLGPACPVVEPLLRFLVLLLADHGSEKDLAVGDDRTRPTPAGHFGDPADVFRFAPPIGQARIVLGNPHACRAAKTRP